MDWGPEAPRSCYLQPSVQSSRAPQLKTEHLLGRHRWEQNNACTSWRVQREKQLALQPKNQLKQRGIFLTSLGFCKDVILRSVRVRESSALTMNVVGQAKIYYFIIFTYEIVLTKLMNPFKLPLSGSCQVAVHTRPPTAPTVIDPVTHELGEKNL